MFKVTCLVEDNKLGAVKRALAVAGVQDVKDQPVVNAKKDANGKLVAETSGSSPDRVWYVLSKTLPRGSKITSESVRGVATSLGLAPGYANAIARQLVEQKRLKRIGRGDFKIIGRA